MPVITCPHCLTTRDESDYSVRIIGESKWYKCRYCGGQVVRSLKREVLPTGREIKIATVDRPNLYGK